MSVLLSVATDDVYAVLDQVMHAHFPDLAEAGVVVEVIFATADEGKCGCRAHGTPCLAWIKVTGPEVRCVKGPDATIRVDAGRYARLRPRQREAMFAHELNHLVLSRDKATGTIKIDDYARPVLKLRPDDWHFTGFRRIHDLFGDDSIEKESLDRLTALLAERQEEFDFRAAWDRTDPVAEEDDGDGVEPDEASYAVSVEAKGGAA